MRKSTARRNKVTTIDLSDFERPGRGRGFVDVFRRRYLLSLLVRKGTSTRYRNSVLGWTWSYVKPLIQFFIYYAVMGFIFGLDRGLNNYPLYLFSGFIMVSFFNEAFGNATTAVVDNKALVKKIYLPRELFPISAIIGAFIHFLPQVAILLIVALSYGWVPSLSHIGAAILGLVIVGLTALGLGLFFAGMNVRYRDAGNFVDVLRQLATWASPVLYTWKLIDENLDSWVLTVYMMNPITIAVELFHYAFWEPTVEPFATGTNEGGWFGFAPHFDLYTIGSVILALLFVVIGQLTFRRFERTFAQDL
ncbi:ABC transporter permease [Microbacterium sp. ZXX196]|nr:ABC transporter permease [Microbacterium sp. ZXX196]